MIKPSAIADGFAVERSQTADNHYFYNFNGGYVIIT